MLGHISNRYYSIFSLATEFYIIWFHYGVDHRRLPPPDALTIAALIFSSASGLFLQYFSAVFPLLHSTKGSEPASMSILTPATFLPAAAYIKAVFPFWSWCLTFATLC